MLVERVVDRYFTLLHHVTSTAGLTVSNWIAVTTQYDATIDRKPTKSCHCKVAVTHHHKIPARLSKPLLKNYKSSLALIFSIHTPIFSVIFATVFLSWYSSTMYFCFVLFLCSYIPFSRFLFNLWLKFLQGISQPCI